MNAKEIIIKTLENKGPCTIDDIMACGSPLVEKGTPWSRTTVSRVLNQMHNGGLATFEWDGIRNFYKVWRLK